MIRSHGLLPTLALTAGLALLAPAALAGNANDQAPPGGDYKAVHALVPLPEFIPGMGALHVDPATLPAGPFAAYDRTGRLVSTIYMIPLADLTARKGFESLAVAGREVRSVDLAYNAGHPGVQAPHYHVVLWHVDPSVAEIN